jgi:hypothetical protein
MPYVMLCVQDAKGSQTTLKARIPLEEGEEFQATGLMVLERNWLDVYQRWEKWVGNKVQNHDIYNMVLLLLPVTCYYTSELLLEIDVDLRRLCG